MFFTDTHCHLTYLKLDSHDHNPSNLLNAMKQANVHRAMAIMCSFDEFEDIKAWVDQSDDELDIGMSVGLHPCQDASVLSSVTVEKLLSYHHDKIWAFGETGLDYHWDDTKKTAQKHSFATHIHASQSVKKPVIVHTRCARQDTLDVLLAERCEHGIIHCFTEDDDFAKCVLDLGMYISFSGIVSFNKSDELRQIAKKIPLDRILIETDSPYLSPVPKRGQVNEPTYVPYVAAALAKVYGKTCEEIGQITSQNFSNLLNQYC
ncbi:TatD family hydrolase [Moraxella sp. Tifton1]|uniref:TatD family hydrolase n=1 Tax=Moraxella oculi TaxID=2940516 RepID=UPI002012A8F4|nr:TatD family hydrolase [Moraxella sp. Tifton1]MCL1623155.1 TatD family hydrolase [Moraxella sp. Tifton1]